MNVLITGASGYIGSDFLSSFKLKFPNSILYVLVNNQDVAEVDNIKVIKKDIRDLTKADFDVNFTYVYHLAGLAHNSFSLDDIEAINVEGTRNLLNVLRGKCMNFIYLSSANVYGDVGVNINESFAPLASTTLMLAKLENEKQIMATSFQNVMIFRLALVISYDSPGNIKTVRDMISKTSCLPFAAANKKRSYLDKNALVSFLSDIPTHKMQGRHIFNLASDEHQSFKDLILKFASLEDKRIRLLYIPSVLFLVVFSIFGKKGLFNKLFRECTIDSTKAKKELGFLSNKIIFRK